MFWIATLCILQTSQGGYCYCHISISTECWSDLPFPIIIHCFLLLDLLPGIISFCLKKLKLTFTNSIFPLVWICWWHSLGFCLCEMSLPLFSVIFSTGYKILSYFFLVPSRYFICSSLKHYCFDINLKSNCSSNILSTFSGSFFNNFLFGFGFSNFYYRCQVELFIYASWGSKAFLNLKANIF